MGNTCRASSRHGPGSSCSREQLLRVAGAISVPLSLYMAVPCRAQGGGGVEGGRALPARADVVPADALCSCPSSSSKAASAQLSSVFGKGCPAKKL